MEPTPLDGSSLPADDRPAVTALTRDSGCCRSLNWRCDLAVGIAGDRVERQLVQHGYVSRCRHANFKVFRHPEGHEMAWVLSTGRVQIRVYPTIEEARRPQVAKSLHGELVCLITGRESSGPEA